MRRITNLIWEKRVEGFVDPEIIVVGGFMDFFGPRFSILLRTTTLNQQQVSNVKVDLLLYSSEIC